MSQVRNISGGPLDVPLLGRVVEADEVAGVPDFQPDGVSPIIWPPDKWEYVDGPPPQDPPQDATGTEM
jgi:hypothetical protein